METVKEVKFSITLYVHGVKKKCRKSERHSFKLGYFPYNDGNFDKAGLSETAKAYVAANMKSVSSPIQVQMLRVEVGTWEHGKTQSFQMFDERHVNFKIESALNAALE